MLPSGLLGPYGSKIKAGFSTKITVLAPFIGVFVVSGTYLCPCCFIYACVPRKRHTHAWLAPLCIGAKTLHMTKSNKTPTFITLSYQTRAPSWSVRQLQFCVLQAKPATHACSEKWTENTITNNCAWFTANKASKDKQYYANMESNCISIIFEFFQLQTTESFTCLGKVNYDRDNIYDEFFKN